jgi:hypothetical protein
MDQKSAKTKDPKTKDEKTRGQKNEEHKLVTRRTKDKGPSEHHPHLQATLFLPNQQNTTVTSKSNTEKEGKACTRRSC